ncbi:hypothetical protein FHW77_005093 [Agrobacterium sp. RC10-4-1]|uniref:hypothetical protein n=1 Tax=Agrobacterium sp. RC10-4-1 TaxID=2587039 RepID=UPI0017953CC1|nr:hypothetical protein [Agrobacterium sp. RC10-4-1]MBA8801338.1 hypothetical protein [Agrobacterium sp. RC10-4-1]
MSTNPIDIATTFFGHWSANRIEDALAMLSDDVLYDNVPLPNIGTAAVLFLRHAGLEGEVLW